MRNPMRLVAHWSAVADRAMTLVRFYDDVADLFVPAIMSIYKDPDRIAVLSHLFPTLYHHHHD